MLIAHCIQALVALLGLAAVFHQVKSEDHFHFNETLNHEERVKRNIQKNNHRHERHFDKRQFFHGRLYPHTHEQALRFEAGKMLLPRQNKQLLDYEYGLMDNTGPGVDCCPSVLEMVEPDGGKNDQDSFVELYKSENYRQRFYELSCHKDVLDKPCRFMDKKLHLQSRCVQMHSYTYALVKDTPDHRNKKLPTFPGAGSGNNTYTLDYISVRSGCACVVMPNNPKKKKKHKKKSGLASHRPVSSSGIIEGRNDS